MPAKVTRRSPTNENSATIDPATPAIAIGPFQLLRSDGRNRSMNRMSIRAPVRTISGSAACRSIEFISGEQSRQAADRGVGDLQDGAGVETERGDPDEQRRPHDPLHRPHVVEPLTEPRFGRLAEVETL